MREAFLVRVGRVGGGENRKSPWFWFGDAVICYWLLSLVRVRTVRGARGRKADGLVLIEIDFD